jgi:hypothetical protein
MTRALLAICCAVVGAFVGYEAFLWMFERGFYALVLPGGLAGLAGGIPKGSNVGAALVIAVLAIVSGLVAEHRVAPFIANDSLWYFLAHVTDLRPVTLALVGLGGAIGFYVPFRRRAAIS